MPATAQDFQNRLDRILSDAQEIGACFVEVKSGDLHRLVGGYPRKDHRMPVCCEVMKKNMKAEDKIIQKPPSGQGATLIIQYRFPR